jgi:hypothetical protein
VRSRAYSEGFAERLRVMLRRRFGGRMPKAAEVARALNTFAPGSPPVAPETVRRWLRGLSVPELYRFRALCAFLHCAPEELAYLLLLHPEIADGGSSRANGESTEGADRGSWDVREVLLRLIASAQDETLSAAYIAFLTAQGFNARFASRAPAFAKPSPAEGEKRKP